MKAITWLATFSAITISATAYAAEGWETDFNIALEKAKSEKKPMLVEFTGSDWCPPCIDIRKNVFSKKEFFNAASKKFVLLELDFPKKNEELAKKNQPFAEKFEIEGFPTVVLVDSEGKEFTRFNPSKFSDVKVFLNHLEEALERKEMD